MLENVFKKASTLTQMERETMNDTGHKIMFSKVDGDKTIKDVPLHYVIWSDTLVLFPIEERMIKDTKWELNDIPRDTILAINVLFNMIHSTKKKMGKLPFRNYVNDMDIPAVKRSVGKDEKGGNPNYVKKITDKLYIIPDWTFWKVGVVWGFKTKEEILSIKWYEIDVSLFLNERIARSLYELVHITEKGLSKQELMEQFSTYKDIIFFELSK